MTEPTIPAPLIFECRPTVTHLPSTSLPDELMIEWVNVPNSATASVFLPGASAAEIMKTAGQLYGGQRLTSSDAHTLECFANGVTYIPIPSESLSDYAGLLSVRIPSAIGSTNPCKVVVRQVTNANVSVDSVRRPQIRRKVMGSFQLTVPVSVAGTLLEPEERLLAYFRWILSTLAIGDRWQPVIQRYVDEIVLRVKAFGGDPAVILPSQVGSIVANLVSERGRAPAVREIEATGKIERLAYDPFGDFEAFVLRTDSGASVTFHTRERHFVELVSWAWRTQIRVTVLSRNGQPREPKGIQLHAPASVPPDFP